MARQEQHRQEEEEEAERTPLNLEHFATFFQFSRVGGSIKARWLSDRGEWVVPKVFYQAKAKAKKKKTKEELDAVSQAFVSAMRGASAGGRLGGWAGLEGFGAASNFGIVGGSFRMNTHSGKDAPLRKKFGQLHYDRQLKDIEHELAAPMLGGAGAPTARKHSTAFTRAKALGAAVVRAVASQEAAAAGGANGASEHEGDLCAAEVTLWDTWWQRNNADGQASLDLYASADGAGDADDTE